MEQICIKRLEIFAKHGALPEENVLGQKFLISAVLHCNTKKAGISDCLDDSVNYAAVAQFITQKTKNHVFRLIERLGWYLAEEILREFSLVQKVEITVEKPWAPVLLPLETVSFSLECHWAEVYLGIGSNMGDKEENIKKAIALLEADEKVRVCRVSQLIETEPVGYTAQDNFLNGVVKIETLRSPDELLALIGEIECALKRERLIHWGPRTIDLDILLYEDRIIETKDLTVPHIEMTNRRFVLEPLCEIAPYKKHPVFGKTVLELKKALENGAS